MEVMDHWKSPDSQWPLPIFQIQCMTLQVAQMQCLLASLFFSFFLAMCLQQDSYVKTSRLNQMFES